jgi:hypothetical protein
MKPIQYYLVFFGMLIIGALIVLYALFSQGLLIVPIAIIMLGMLFIGFAAPDLFDEWTGYGHTLYLPVGVAIVGILGIYLIFTDGIFTALFTQAWCGKEPCTPFFMLIVSFAVGNILHWAAHILNKEEIELLGPEGKEHHKPEEKEKKKGEKKQ